MGLFDVANYVTAGKAQETVNMAGTDTVARKNIAELDTTYGGGQGMKPNPAYEEWARKKAGLEAALASASAAAQMGGAFGGANDAAQQRVDSLRQQIDALGPPPPQQIQNQLTQDVQAVRDQGASAVDAVQRDVRQVQQTGDQAQSQGQQVSAAAGAQANAAQRRDSPNLVVDPTGRVAQTTASTAAGAFTPDTSGVAGVRQAGATGAANIAAAGAAGSSTISMAGQQGANNIAAAGAAGAEAVGSYRAATSGIDALNRFAQGPSGPSAAEALLRLQAARDKAAALSRARSVRGGPGAVAEAMKIAQAEGAAMSADTRGQMTALRAQEAAAERGQQLQALTSAGGLQQQASQTNLGAIQGGAQLGLSGATAAGQLSTQAQTAAADTRLTAQTAAAGTALGAQQAATSAELQGSGQALQGIQIRADIANNIRAMDIDQAKAQLGADLQTMGMNDEQTRFFAGLGEQARQAGIAAKLQAQQAGMNGDQAAAAIQLQYAQQAWQMLSADQQAQIQRLGIERGVIAQNQANQQAQTQQTMGFLGTLLMAGGTALASDRRVKHDVRRLRSMAAALRSTPGSSYRYKDPKRHGEGVHHGPMAQDLEKTPEFRSAVKTVGKVKMVDTGRLALAHHAALSDLQRQIDRLEKLGRRKEARA